ncbi:MAG: calcium-binding protein [Reyranellaceae bacterium]
MPVSAAFSSTTGVLTVRGDTGSNAVVIGRDPAGNLLVNGGAVAISGGTPTAANTVSIRVLGLDGPDALSLDEANGPLPPITLDGGLGDDTLVGGGGADSLLGGEGNDVVTGGRGNDIALLGPGDDTFVWNPGDGNDKVDGQGGLDSFLANGASLGESIEISAVGGRARFFRDVEAVTADLGTVETITFNALGGADTVRVRNLAGTAVTQVGVNLAGNGGIGGDGAADLVAVDGSIRGDVVTVDAVGGAVSVGGLFAGTVVSNADAGDVLTLSLLSGADRATVNDLAGTGLSQVKIDLGNGGAADGQADEAIVNATGGADVVSVSVVAGSVSVAGLAATVGVLNADAALDRLTVNGQEGDDAITAGSGLAALVSLTFDGGQGNDTLVGGDGADMLLGGEGNDAVTGGQGNDTALLGGGDDSFVWNPGDGTDTVDGQDGLDSFQANGTSLAESIEISASGGRTRFVRDIAAVTADLGTVETIVFNALGGADTVQVRDLTGTGVARVMVNLAGNGGISGDGAADLVTVEGTAGGDTVTVGAVGGAVNVDGLAPGVTILGAEAALDRVTVSGQGGDDTITAGSGLAALVRLTLDGGSGNDTLVGGDGADTLLGGGDDTFVWNPGDGNDTVDGDGGQDSFQVNGANVAERIDISANGGRARFSRDIAAVTADLGTVETIVFNALGGADTVKVRDLTGTGVARVSLNLGIGGIGGDGAADLLTVEGTVGGDTATVGAVGGAVSVGGLAAGTVVSNADAGDVLTLSLLGGADRATVNDLSGAGLGQVKIDLGNGGVADGQADEVIVNATGVAEVVSVSAVAGGVSVVGLAATIGVLNADATLDRVTVSGQGGDDTITAGNGLAALVRLTLDGGSGNDTLVGGDGADTLLGGEGNDRVTGGRSNDTALLGGGDDTFVWNPGDGNDTVDGDGGQDSFQVNGANVAERIDISANGGRARFSRDIAAVTADLGTVETIVFNALGGADTVQVRDLTGTGVT